MSSRDLTNFYISTECAIIIPEYITITKKLYYYLIELNCHKNREIQRSYKL
jgi:hypothetical protein